MKALTVRQPWASLIALCAKRFETRNWTTTHRGPLAIHASSRIGELEHEWLRGNDSARRLLTGCELPTGVIVAICELVDVIVSDGRVPAGATRYEVEFGDFTPGRYLWRLDGVRQYRSTRRIPGSLGLWDWRARGQHAASTRSR